MGGTALALEEPKTKPKRVATISAFERSQTKKRIVSFMIEPPQTEFRPKIKEFSGEFFNPDQHKNWICSTT